MIPIIVRTKQHLSYLAQSHKLDGDCLNLLLNQQTGLRALVPLNEVQTIIGDETLKTKVAGNSIADIDKLQLQNQTAIDWNYCAVAFRDNIVTGSVVSENKSDDYISLKQSKKSGIIFQIPKKIIKSIIKLDGSVTDAGSFSTIREQEKYHE